MKQIWVRPANAGDSQNLAEWLVYNADKNLLDEKAVTRPGTMIFCAHDDKPLVYMPLQFVGVLESLAPRPGATQTELAAALKELVKTAAFSCRSMNVHEIMFVCKDDKLADLAVKHGFEELPFRTLRLRLDDLEEKQN